MNRLTVIDHPILLKEWDFNKNKDLAPAKCYLGSPKKVWWKCNHAEDHVWLSAIRDRYRKQCKCPFCTNKKVAKSNCLATTHPEIVSQWHPSLNAELTPFKFVSGSEKQIWWKCNQADDHIWKTSIKERIKFGCPCCCNQKVVRSNCLATTHPHLVYSWVSDLNLPLTPYSITAGSRKKAWWQCIRDNSHQWQSVISTRKNHDCPYCFQKSKGEQIIKDFLISKNIKFQQQYTFNDCKKTNRLRFDFAIWINDSLKLIEYQGIQHFMPCNFGNSNKNQTIINFEKQVIRDQIKKEYCQINSIPFLEINYNELKTLTYLVESFIG